MHSNGEREVPAAVQIVTAKNSGTNTWHSPTKPQIKDKKLFAIGKREASRHDIITTVSGHKLTARPVVLPNKRKI